MRWQFWKMARSFMSRRRQRSSTSGRSLWFWPTVVNRFYTQSSLIGFPRRKVRNKKSLHPTTFWRELGSLIPWKTYRFLSPKRRRLWLLEVRIQDSHAPGYFSMALQALRFQWSRWGTTVRASLILSMPKRNSSRIVNSVASAQVTEKFRWWISNPKPVKFASVNALAISNFRIGRPENSSNP